jgi:HAD superfamily hydrolase (TIGR01509 family)
MNPIRAPITAVLFDMDGLLLDSERLALAVIARCARELGLEWEEAIGLSLIGRNIVDSDAILRARYGEGAPLEGLRQGFRRHYDAHIDAHGVPIKPGVGELLDLLDARRLPRAVATSTGRERALRKMRRVGLLARFDALVSGDEVARGKPAPDIFLAAAGALAVAPSACLVLEDSNAGVRAALAAGMQVIMVPDVLAPDADLLALGVRVEPSIERVVALLAEVAPAAIEPAGHHP